MSRTVVISRTLILSPRQLEGGLFLPGVVANYASTPDANALDVTGDIELALWLAPTDWTPAAVTDIFSKFQTTSQRSYGLQMETSGAITLFWSATGSATLASTSTAATGFTDGTIGGIRATMDVDNGAGSKVIKFYTTTDPSTTTYASVNWTQLGTTNTVAGTTSIFNSTSILEMGGILGGTANMYSGIMYRAVVVNGLGGTVVLDANFTVPSFGATSFTESSVNAATVTINGTGNRPAKIANRAVVSSRTVV